MRSESRGRNGYAKRKSLSAKNTGFPGKTNLYAIYYSKMCYLSVLYDLPEGSKLKFELDSWPYFEGALRLEDRTLLRKMNEDIVKCAEAVENCKEGYETEAYLLTLLIHQQKFIDFLETKLQVRK